MPEVVEDISFYHKAALQALVCIKKKPTHVAVVEDGFRYLKALLESSKDEDLTKSIIDDSDGIKVVESIMEENPDERCLQTEGRALLDHLYKTVNERLGEDEIEAILLAMTTLPAVVKAMRQHLTIVEVQRGGIHFLERRMLETKTLRRQCLRLVFF